MEHNIIFVILILIWTHFVVDFILQSDQMAINKSKNGWGWGWLSYHVAIYTAGFAWLGWKFALITFVTHFITDAITSRINGYLWRRELRHWFFVGIGFDQAIHISTLILTFYYLTGVK